MIAVLFVERNSIYKSYPGLDCYDEDRDARTFPGGIPVIAHPPCRLWGRLYKLSTAPESEKDLARFAVAQIRQWGGVLEHPAHSKLWKDQGLPLPGDYSNPLDFTLDIDQFWFGHLAKKRTWLYIHGITVNDLPQYTINLNLITHVVATSSRKNMQAKYLKKSLRNGTPAKMAEWLIELARRIPSPTPAAGVRKPAQDTRRTQRTDSTAQ